MFLISWGSVLENIINIDTVESALQAVPVESPITIKSPSVRSFPHNSSWEMYWDSFLDPSGPDAFGRGGSRI